MNGGGLSAWWRVTMGQRGSGAAGQQIKTAPLPRGRVAAAVGLPRGWSGRAERLPLGDGWKPWWKSGT
jgi:hypothetical protein